MAGAGSVAERPVLVGVQVGEARRPSRRALLVQMQPQLRDVGLAATSGLQACFSLWGRGCWQRVVCRVLGEV
jgi:hypothetical protein